MPKIDPNDVTLNRVVGRWTVESIPNFLAADPGTILIHINGAVVSLYIDPKNRQARVFVKNEEDEVFEEWTGDCDCALDEQIAYIKNKYVG